MSLPTSSNGKGSSLSQEYDITENDSCSCYNIHIQVAESKSEIDLRIEPDVPHKQSPHRTVENAAVGSKSAKHAEPHKVTIFTHDNSMENVHIEYKYPKNNVSEGMKEHSQTHSKEKVKCHELQPQNKDVVSKSYHNSTDDRRREENRYRQESQEIRQNDHKRPLLRTRTVLYTKREVKNPREAVARLEARQGLFSRSVQQYVIRAVDLCTTPFTRNSELREERSKSKISPEIHPKRHHHKSEAGTTSIKDNKTNNLSQESDGKYKGQLGDKRFRIHIDDLDYKKVDNSSEFIRKNNDIQKKNSDTESRSAELDFEITNANKTSEQAETIISQYNSSSGKNFSEVISNTKTPELHNIPKGKFREKIDTSQKDISELFKDYSEKLDKVQDSNRQIFHDQNVSTKCEKTVYDTTVIDDEKSPVKRKKRRLEDSPSRPNEKLKLQENINKTVTKSKDNVKSQRKFARRKTRSKISKLHHFTTDSSETDKDNAASFLRERSLSASPTCKHSSHRKKFKHRGMSPKNQQIIPQEMTEESYQNYTKTHESKDQLNKDALDAPINKETSNSESAIPNKQENQKNSEIIEIFDRKHRSSPGRHNSEKQDKLPVQQHKEGTKTSPAFLVRSAKPKKKTGDISQNRIKSNEVFMVHWFTERNSQQEKSQVVEEGGEMEKSSNEKDDNSLTQEVLHNQNHQNHHVEQKQDTHMSKSKDAGIYEDNKTTKYKESLVQKVKYDTKDPDVAEENTEDTPSKEDLRNSLININNHESSETMRESVQQKSFGKWQENAHEEKQRNLRHSDSFISYKELAANRRRKKRYSKYKKRSSQGSCRDMMYSVERGRTPPRSRKKRSQEPRHKSERQNVTQNTYRKNNAQACTSRAIPEKIREDSISRRERSKSKNKKEKKNASLTRPDLEDVGKYIKLEVPENSLLTRTAIVDKNMRPAMLSEWQYTKPEISDNEQFTRLEIPNKRQLTRHEISDSRQLTRLEMPDKRQLTRPEISDSEQFTRLEMPDKRQLTRHEISDSRQLTRLEMPDKRQLSIPEISDSEQFIRLEMPDKRQLTRPEISDSRQLTRLEMPDKRQLARPEIYDNRQLTKSEMLDNRQLARPEISDSRQFTRVEMPDKRQLTRPEISDNRQLTKSEMPDNRQLTRPEISDSRQLTRPEISDSRQLARPEISDSRQFTRVEMPDKRKLTRPEISDSRQLTMPEMPDNRQLTKSEIIDNKQLTRTEIPDSRHLTKPEVTDKMQLSRPDVIADRQLTRLEIAEKRQLAGPETDQRCEMADAKHNTRPEVIVDRPTRTEITDRRQLTGPEPSDHRQLPRSETADERQLTRPEILEVRRPIRPKIPDKRRFKKFNEKPDKRKHIRPETANERQLTRPETANERRLTRREIATERQLTRPETANERRLTRREIATERQLTRPETANERQLTRPETANERQLTRPEIATDKQLTRPEIANEQQLLRPEKAYNEHFTKFETVVDECCTRSEIPGSKTRVKGGLTIEKSLVRQDVSFKTKQHKKHYITKSKQSRKNSFSGSMQLSEKLYKEKETKHVKSAQTKVLVSVKTSNKNTVTANKQPERYCVAANTSEDKTQTTDASNTMTGETKEESQEVKELSSHKSRNKMRKTDQISNNKHRPLGGTDETNLKSNTPSHLKESSCQNFPKISENKLERSNQNQNQMAGFSDNIQKAKWEPRSVAYAMTATTRTRIKLSAQRAKNVTSDKCTNSEEKSKVCKRTADSDKSQRSATGEIKEKDIVPFQTPRGKRKSTSTPPKRTEKTETVKPLSSPSDKGKKPPEMEKKDDKDVSKGNIKQKDEEVNKSVRRENSSLREPWRSPAYQPRTSQSYPRRRKERVDMSRERKTGTVILEPNYLPRVDESLVEESLQFLRDSFEGRNKIPNKESMSLKKRATSRAISPQMHSRQAQKSMQPTRKLSKRPCSNSSTISRQSSEVNKNKPTALQQQKSEKEEQIILNETEVRKLKCTSETVQRRTQSRQRKCDIQRLDVNTSRKESTSPKKFVRNEGESSRMTPNHERKKAGPNAGKSPERTKTIEKENVTKLKDIPSKMLIITLKDPKDEKQSSYKTNRSNDVRGEIIFGPNECKGGSSQEAENGTSNSKCETEMMDNSEETIRESTENTSQGVSFFFHRNNLPGEIVEGTHNDNKRLVSEKTFIMHSSDNKKIWNGRYEYLNSDNTDSSFGRHPPDTNTPDNKSSRVQRSSRENNKEENKMCSTDDTEIQLYNNLHRKPDLSRSSNKRLPNKKQSRSRKHEEMHGSHTSNVIERQLSKSDHKNLPVIRSANKWVSDKPPSQSRTRCLHKTFTVSETDRTLEDSQSHSLDAIQSSIHWVSNKTELQNRKSEDINNIVEIQLSNGDKDYLSRTNWLHNKQSSFCRTPVNKSYTITNVEKQPPNHDGEKHTNELEPSRKHSPSKKPSDAKKDNVKENHFRKSRYQELLDEIQAEMNQLDILGISHINSIKGRRQVKSIIIPLKQAGDSNDFSSIELPEKRSLILPITDGSMNYLLSRHKLHHPANNPPPQIQVHYVTVAKKRNSSSDTSSSLSSSSGHNLRYRSVSRDRKSPYRCRELNSNIHTSEGSLSNEECSATALATSRRRKTPEKVKKQRHGSKKKHKSSNETESQDKPVSRNRSVRIEHECPSRYEKCPSTSTRSAAVTCPYPDEEDEIRSCFPVHSRHRPKRKAMYDPLAQPNSRRIPRRRSRRSSSTYDTCSVYKHSSRTTVCSKKSTCSRKSRRSRKHHKHYRHRRHLCDDNDDSETCSIGGDETENDECIDKSKSSDSDVPPRRSQRADNSKCPYIPPSLTLNYCELTYSSDSTQTSHRSPSAETPRFNREPENSRSLGLSIKPSPIHEHGRTTVPSRRADQKSRKAIKASNSQETATSAVASDIAAYGTSSDDYERVRKLKNTKKGGNVYSQYNVQTNVVPSFTSSLYDTLLFNNKYCECKEIFRHPKFLSSSSGKLNEHLSAEELGSFSFKRQDETTNQAKLLQMKLKNCLNKNYSEFECPKISQDENKFCKSFSEFSENGRKSVSLRYTKEALESFNRALKALPTMTKSTECDRQDPGVQDNKAIELQVMKDRHQNLTELASSPQIPLQEGMQYCRNKNNNPRQRFTGKEQKGKNSNLIKSASKLTLNLFPLNAPKSTIVYMAGQVRNSRSSKQKKNVDKRERCKCPKCKKVQKTSQQPGSSAKESDKNVACMNKRTLKEVEPPVSVLYTRSKTNNTTSKLPEHAEVQFVEGSDDSHDINEGKYQVKEPCQLKVRKSSLVELFRNTTQHTPSLISLSDEKVNNINIRCECKDKHRQDKDYEKFHASAELDSSKMKKNIEIEAKISTSDSNASFTSLSSKMSFTPSANLPPCSGNYQIPEDVLVLTPNPHSNISDKKLLAIEYEQKEDDETTYGQVKELNDVLEKDTGKEKCEDISLCEERACREQAIKMKAEKQKQDQRKQKEYKNQKHSYHSEVVLKEHTSEEDIKSISQGVSVSPTHSDHLEDVPKEHIKSILKEASISSRHSNKSDNVLKEIKFISQEAFTSPRHSNHSGDVLKDHIPKEHVKATSKEVSTSPRHSNHSEDVLQEHTPEEHIKAISMEGSTSPTQSHDSEDILIENTPKEQVKANSKETPTSPRHSYHSQDVLKENIPKEHIKAISKEASTSPRHSYHSQDLLKEQTPEEHIKSISKEASTSPTRSHHSEDVLKEPTPKEHIKAISKEASTSPRHSHHSKDVLKDHIPKEHVKSISKEASTSPRHSHHSEDVLKDHTPKEHIKDISQKDSTSLTHSYHSEDFLREPTSEEWRIAIPKEGFTSPTHSHHSEEVLKEPTPEEDTKVISKKSSISPTHSHHSKEAVIEPTAKEHLKAISQYASPPPDDNFECISKELQDFAKRDFSTQTNVSDSEDHFEEIAFNENARNDSKKAFSTYAVEDVAPRKQKALLARREIILESYLLAIQTAHVQAVVLPSPEVYYARSPNLFVEEGGENSLMVATKPFQGKCDCIWCTGSENEEGGECSLPSCMVSNLALPALPQDTTISLLSIVTSSIESVPSIQSPQNTKSLLLQKIYNSLVSVKPSSSKDETALFLEPEVSTKNNLNNSNRSNKSDIDTKGISEPRESLNKHQAPFNSSEGEGITGTQQLGLHETQATDETPPAEESESLLAFRAKSKSQMKTEENDLLRNSVPQQGQSNGNEIRDTSSKEENQFPNSRSSPPSSYNETSRTSRFLPFTTKKTSQMSNDGADLPDNSVPQKGSSTAEEIRSNVFDTKSLEVNPLPTNNSSTPSIHNKSSRSSGCLPFRIKKKSQTSIEDTNLPDNSVPQRGQSTSAETGDNVCRIISKEKQSLPSSYSFTASSNNKSSKTSGFLPFRTKKRSQTSIEDSDLPDNSVTQKEQSNDNEIISSASNTSNQQTNRLPNNHSSTASSNNKSCRNSGCLPFRTKKKSQMSIEDNELPHNLVPQKGPSTTEKNGSNSKSSHEIHPLPTGQSFTPSSYNQTARSTGLYPFKTKGKSQVNNKNIDLPDDSTSQSSAQDKKDNSILETPRLPPDHNSSTRSESNTCSSNKCHRSGTCTIISSPEGELFLHFCPKHSDETIQLTPDTSDTQMDNKTLKRGVFEVVSSVEKMPFVSEIPDSSEENPQPLEQQKTLKRGVFEVVSSRKEMPFVSEIPNSSEEKPQPLEQQNEQHNISANKCQTGNRNEWHFCPLYPESYSAVSSEEILVTTAEEIPKSWSEVSNISTNFEGEREIMEDVGRSRVQVYHIIPDDITNVFQLRNRLLHKVPDFSDSNDEFISSCDLDKSKSAQTVDRITQGSDSVYSGVPDISKVKYSIENQGENKKDKTDKLCLYQEGKPLKERNSSFKPLASVSPEVMLNTVPIKNDPSLQVTQKRDSSEGKQNNFIQTPTNSLKTDIQLDFDHRDTDSSSNKLTDGNHVKNSAEEEIQSLSNFLEELEVWQSQVSSEISLYFKLLNKDPSSTSTQQSACNSTTAERVKKANIKENGTNIIGASGQQSSTGIGQSITRNEGFSYLLPFSTSDKSISSITNPQNYSLPETTTASQQFQELSSVEKFSNFSSFSRPGESIECITTTQINSLPELITTSQEFQKPSSLVGYIGCDGIEHEEDQNTQEEAGCSAYYSNSVPLVYSFKQEYVIADHLEIATSPGRVNLSPQNEDIIHAYEGVIQPINPRNRQTIPQVVLVSNTFSAKENMKIVEKLSHNVSEQKMDKTENDLEMYYYSNKGTDSNNQYESSFENRENEYSQGSPDLDDVRIFPSLENVELIDVALGSSVDNITKVEVHSTRQKKESLLSEGKSLDLLVTINGSSDPETQELHKNIFKDDTSVTSTSTDEVLETLSKPEISSFSINYLQSITTETEENYSLKSHIKNEKGTTREKFIKEMEDTSSKTDDASNMIMKNYGNSGFELNSITLENRTNEQFRNETKIMNESGSSAYTTMQNTQWCSLGSDEELLTLSINTSQNVTFSIDVIESDLSIPDNEKDKSLIYFKVPGQESGKSVEQPDILNDFEQITDFSKNNNKEDTDYIEILKNMYTIPKAFDTEISIGNSKTILINNHPITNIAPYSPQAVTLLQSNSEDFLEDTTHESTRRQIQAAAPQANMKRSPERSKKFGLDKDLLSETDDRLLPQTEREQVKNSHPKSQNVKKKVQIQESSNVTLKRKKEDAVLSVKNLDHSKHTLAPEAKKSSSSNKGRRNVPGSERERDDLNTPKGAKLKKKVFFGLLGGWSQHHKIDKSSGSRHDAPSRVHNAKSRSSTSSGGARLTKNCEDSKKDHTAEPSTSAQVSRMFWPSCVKKIVQVPKKAKHQGSRENSR